MRRGLLIGGLIFMMALGLGVAPTTAGGKKLILRAQSTWPAGMPIFQEAAERFANNVSKLTNGRISIEMHPAGAIVPAFEVLEAVNRGTLDLECGWTGYWKGKFPAAPLFSEALGAGAGVFDQLEWYSWMYYGGGMKLLQEMYDRGGFKVKVIHHYGILPSEDLAWSHKPIRKLEDFKGLKFRTVGYWGEVLTKLGASVVTLPGGEVYPALERGVLDAAEFSTPQVDKMLGFHEICKYMLVPGIHQACVPLETVFNRKKWESLSEQDRFLIELAAKESFLWSLSVGIARDAEAIEFFKKHGTQIIALPPEELKKAKEMGAEVVKKYAEKDPFIAKVVKSRLEFDKMYKGYEKPVLGTLIQMK